MVFKSSKQRKAFFSRKNNPRANINPTILNVKVKPVKVFKDISRLNLGIIDKSPVTARSSRVRMKNVK